MSVQQAEATATRSPMAPLAPVDDPAAWTKESLGATDAWIYPLSPAEVAELDAAVAAIEARGLDIIDIGLEDFTLPTLAKKLAAAKQQILRGLGLALVRGVPVARYTRHQAAVAFWCIGLHIGVPVSQNAKDHLIGHVENLAGSMLNNPTHRGSHTLVTMP